jgi:hypothetical protein
LSNELFEDDFLNVHLVDIAGDSVKGMLVRLRDVRSGGCDGH